jgi:hypothetical protein
MGILDKLLKKDKDDDVPDFGPAGTDPFANDPFASPPSGSPGMGPTPQGMGQPLPPPPFPAQQEMFPQDSFAPAQQSYPLQTTPSFPTPMNIPQQSQQPSGVDSEISMQLERINHRLDLISEKIGKIEQTLDFMQRYTYSNR